MDIRKMYCGHQLSSVRNGFSVAPTCISVTPSTCQEQSRPAVPARKEPLKMFIPSADWSTCQMSALAMAISRRLISRPLLIHIRVRLTNFTRIWVTKICARAGESVNTRLIVKGISSPDAKERGEGNES